MAAGADTSSYAASFGFLHTRTLAATPVGEEEPSFERFASVEAVVVVIMEAIAIAAEETRLLVAAAAQVYIDDVDPSYVELTPVSARFDTKDGPDRWGRVLLLGARRFDVPHYSDPLPCSLSPFVLSGPVLGRRPENQSTWQGKEILFRMMV